MVCIRIFQWISPSSFRIFVQSRTSTSVVVLSPDPLILRRLVIVSRFGGNLLSLFCFFSFGCVTNRDLLRSVFISALFTIFWSDLLLSVLGLVVSRLMVFLSLGHYLFNNRSYGDDILRKVQKLRRFIWRVYCFPTGTDSDKPFLEGLVPQKKLKIGSRVGDHVSTIHTLPYVSGCYGYYWSLSCLVGHYCYYYWLLGFWYMWFC